MDEHLFIGLMSGTSLDGIDAVLVNFSDSGNKTNVIATHEHAYPPALTTELESVIRNWENARQLNLQDLDKRLGLIYSDAVNKLLELSGKDKTAISAVGCHGQTVSHQPDADEPFSLQLGDGQTIADKTGLRVINDFRNADIALGGQGAPLVPAFHEWAFGATSSAAVVNIGGIANITELRPDAPVAGYDTGPGNTLLDYWCRLHLDEEYDRDGNWARSGSVNEPLLKNMLDDPYFSKPSPKSTGREYFNSNWLDAFLQQTNQVEPADVQATLTELTAHSIVKPAIDFGAGNIFICGGGAYNRFLMERISRTAAPVAVTTTGALGIEPAWVEAIAFAWLARARLANEPAGRPSVTGATNSALLGVIYDPKL